MARHSRQTFDKLISLFSQSISNSASLTFDMGADYGQDGTVYAIRVAGNVHYTSFGAGKANEVRAYFWSKSEGQGLNPATVAEISENRNLLLFDRMLTTDGAQETVHHFDVKFNWKEKIHSAQRPTISVANVTRGAGGQTVQFVGVWTIWLRTN